MSRCRSCGAPLLWARTVNGKKMPLEPQPYTGDDPRGLFVLRDRNSLEGPLAISAWPDVFPGERLYRSHWKCPHADQHRRSR